MNREDYRIKAKKSIDKVFRRLDEYESDVKKMSESVRQQFEENVNEMKRQKLVLQEKYHQMAHASEERWEETRKGFNDSMLSFKEGFEKIREAV